MLRSVKRLQHETAQAIDGAVGHVHDTYFDDHQWTTRYLVVSLGRWLPARRILVPPSYARWRDWDRTGLRFALSRAQMEQSPGVDTARPVSRQHEIEVYEYYAFPYAYYWLGMSSHEPRMIERLPGDPNLRSAREVTGYHVQAFDGEIGHVEDFLVDPVSWAIRYLVVDTRRWWPGKKVLVAPEWVLWVAWGEHAVHVGLHRETIRNAPEYDPGRPVQREYEARLHEHYGHPKYWEPRDEPAESLG